MNTLFRLLITLFFVTNLQLFSAKSPYFEKYFKIGHELVDQHSTEKVDGFIYIITFENLTKIKNQKYKYVVNNCLGMPVQWGEFEIDRYGYPLISAYDRIIPLAYFKTGYTASWGEFFNFQIFDYDGNCVAKTRLEPKPLHGKFTDEAKVKIDMIHIGKYRLKAKGLQPGEKIELAVEYGEKVLFRKQVSSNTHGQVKKEVQLPLSFMKKGGDVAVTFKREDGEEQKINFRFTKLDQEILRQVQSRT